MLYNEYFLVIIFSIHYVTKTLKIPFEFVSGATKDRLFYLGTTPLITFMYFKHQYKHYKTRKQFNSIFVCFIKRMSLNDYIEPIHI